MRVVYISLVAVLFFIAWIKKFIQMNIYLSCAIGDVFAIESFFSDEFRNKLTTIYYSTSKQPILEVLFDSLPNYRQLQHKSITDVEIFGFQELTTIFVPKILAGELAYNHSSWMQYKLCDISFDLPKDYFVICPYGDQNHENRNFSVPDWEQTLLFLKRKRLQGVVLNNLNEPVPIDPLLIDLSTRTTILEAIEVLKAASGYIGVDSSLAALAAKKFPVGKFLIKTTNSNVVEWSRFYYAPHHGIKFLNWEINTSKL